MNMVCALSVCHPCMSGDGQARECSTSSMCGSVLIESSHNPSSGGYAYDLVTLGQAVMECDSIQYKKSTGWQEGELQTGSQCHAPSWLDLGEPSHTCIHLMTDHDLTQLMHHHAWAIQNILQPGHL